jgi:hypothetical protein
MAAYGDSSECRTNLASAVGHQSARVESGISSEDCRSVRALPPHAHAMRTISRIKIDITYLFFFLKDHIRDFLLLV